MPEWAVDLTSTGMIIVAIVVLGTKWLNYQQRRHPCSATLNPTLTLVMTTLNEQQKVLQGLILTVNNLLTLSTEIISRVKDLEQDMKEVRK